MSVDFDPKENQLIQEEEELPIIRPNRKRVGLQQVIAFNSAFKNISRLVEKDIFKTDAKVAYLQKLEESNLYPKRGNIVTDRGRNRSIAAREYFMNEARSRAFGAGMHLTEAHRIGIPSTSLTPMGGV